MFVVIPIDFIKDFTYLLHFYLRYKNVMAQKLDCQYFWLIKHIKLRSFNV